MDLVNRLIAWAAYVTGAVLIGSGAFFAFHYYRQSGHCWRSCVGPVGRRRKAECRVPRRFGLPPAQPARRTAVPPAGSDPAAADAVGPEDETAATEDCVAGSEERGASERLRAELDDAIDLLGVLAAEVAGAEPVFVWQSGDGHATANGIGKTPGGIGEEPDAGRATAG